MTEDYEMRILSTIERFEKQENRNLYDRGFYWGGLYEHFDRVSCFCCPLQRIGDLRTLRIIRPELWQRMLDWEIEMEKTGSNRGFRGCKTVHDLNRRFTAEDMQMDLFEEVAV